MAFDAAALGFLAPTSAPPAYGGDLDDIIGDTVAGITGLDRDIAVRPRFVDADAAGRPNGRPSAQPPRGIAWCAVGHTDITSDANADTVHDGHGDGSDTAYRGEEISVLASFYGPTANALAALLRDGLMVQRNRARLLDAGLAYGRGGTVRNATGLVNTEFLGRYDFDFVLRRRVARTYAVPNVRSVTGRIFSTNGSPQGPRLGVTTPRVG